MAYQGCFCGLSVETVPPDIGTLFYMTCCDGPVAKQHEQQMWCHTDCFRGVLHPSVKLYAAFLATSDSEEEA